MRNVYSKSDSGLNILLLQIISIALIIAVAVVLRICGGDFYKTISNWYHRCFDDITLASEVLNPDNTNAIDNKNDDIKNENIVTDDNKENIIHNNESMYFEEEFDDKIDSDILSNVTEISKIETISVSAKINTFAWPVSGIITSNYGMRVHPISKNLSMHNGIDIAANKGTKIISAYDGVVMAAGYSNSYGYYIIISHNENVKTLYAHCDSIYAKEGQSVKRGETIAFVGSTGRSTGPHLHFEIRIGNQRIDPIWLLEKDAEVVEV